MNQGVYEEITNLYQKKREQAARIDQAMERISELESQVFENKDEHYKNKNNLLDAGAVRTELLGKIDDLKTLNEEDLTQLNNRVMKRIDDLQQSVNTLDQEVEDVDRKRINGENEILKKSLQLLKEGSINTDIMDLKRRASELEKEVFKPIEKEEPKLKIEEEKIIKDIIEGMAELEAEIKNLKKLTGDHDVDIQDAAKLIHVLDQQAIKDKENLENIGRRVENVEGLKDSFNKYKTDNDKNLNDLRIAWENEFSTVKKAEIDDFNKLNNKLSNLVSLQDTVEQLANQIDHIQQEVDSMKNIKATPIKMSNKVGADNITSSMTPTTSLFTEIKNRLENKNFAEDTDDLQRATRTINRDEIKGRNIMQDFSDKNNPSIDRVRESYFVKSKLARHLADDYGQRNREFIKIDKDIVHRDDLKYKLKGDEIDSESHHKCNLSNL